MPSSSSSSRSRASCVAAAEAAVSSASVRRRTADCWMRSRSGSAVGGWPTIWLIAGGLGWTGESDVPRVGAAGDGGAGGCLAARGVGGGDFGLECGEVGLKGFEAASLARDGLRMFALALGEGRDAGVELAQRCRGGMAERRAASSSAVLALRARWVGVLPESGNIASQAAKSSLAEGGPELGPEK